MAIEGFENEEGLDFGGLGDPSFGDMFGDDDVGWVDVNFEVPEHDWQAEFDRGQYRSTPNESFAISAPEVGPHGWDLFGGYPYDRGPDTIFGGGGRVGTRGGVPGFNLPTEEGGGSFFGDMVDDAMDPTSRGSFYRSMFGLGFGTGLDVLDRTFAALRDAGYDVQAVSPSDFNPEEGGEGATVRNRAGNTVTISNQGQIVASNDPEVPVAPNAQAFDISSLEGTFIPIGQGSGLTSANLPPLGDPTGLTGEDAIKHELRVIQRAAFEESLKQRDLQQALLPQLLRGAGAQPVLDNSGKMIGFEIPKGGFPVSPGVESDLEKQEEILMADLRKQLGPGFETSTPGQAGIQAFNQAATEARDLSRTASLGRISSLLGLPVQTTQNISGLGSQLTGVAGIQQNRLALNQQAAFQRAQIDAASRAGDTSFGDIFGQFAGGVGKGFGAWGGAAFGGLFE